jgi:hypothetical protein
MSISAPPILPELLFYRNANWDLKDDTKYAERPTSEVNSGANTSPTYVAFAEEHPIVSRRELWSYYGEWNFLLAISQC